MAAVERVLASLIDWLSGKNENGKAREHFQTLIALDHVHEEAKELLTREANQFYMEVVLNESGQRDAFLSGLATLAPHDLAATLVTYLKFTDGFDRAAWFPEVFDQVVITLRKRGRGHDAEQIGVALWERLAEVKDAPWLSPEAKDGIIGHLEKYVEIDLHTTQPGATISHP